MKARFLCAAAFCSVPFITGAQTLIEPEWSQQWAFGQDTVSYPILTVSWDNHVAVDASTGDVYVTIDDQLELYSPHFDLLYRFTSGGTDLTPEPVPLLGNVAPDPFGPSNAESTRDLVVREGAVFHARELSFSFPDQGTAGSVRVNDGADVRWKFGLGNGYVWGQGSVLVDAQGVVVLRDNMAHAITHEGWIEWSRSVQPYDRDAVLVGTEVVVLMDGSIQRFDRMTGAPIGGPVPLFTDAIGNTITTDGTRIFYSYYDYDGNSSWACAQLDGTIVWSHSIAASLQFMAMAVDNFGRPWLVGNPTVEGESPLLIVTGSDGGSYDTFTYGSSMNDMAMGDGQAYITGALADATSTYLIAIGTDITTASAEPVVEAAIALYPQPANTSLTITNAGRLDDLIVHDATGKSVRVPLRNAATLDVSSLSEGIYFLHAITERGPIARRFVVSR